MLCQANILKSHGYDVKNAEVHRYMYVVWMKSTATYFRGALSTLSEVLNFFQKLRVLFCEIKFYNEI
jgi:hypothetical protein